MAQRVFRVFKRLPFLQLVLYHNVTTAGPAQQSFSPHKGSQPKHHNIICGISRVATQKAKEEDAR